MKTDLRLRFHATQAQPCFPAASNTFALPGGNGIFTATPTERITHYTLLRKVQTVDKNKSTVFLYKENRISMSNI